MMVWKLQEEALSDDDRARLAEFVRVTARFTQYEQVAAFEAEFCVWQGCHYAVFVNSGSSANLLLIAALAELRHWQPGDEVIVPAVTWPTTVTPIIQGGLTPVFVDVNVGDLALDYDRVAAAITPRTRAVFVAHLLGFPVDVGRLRELAGRQCDIIEDCCESQGATQAGVKVGSLGLAGTFSFYWGHHMTTIEGGMIVTDCEALYKLLVLKRSHGLARELPTEYHAALRARYPDIDFRFLFLTAGYNMRSTELAAVLGRAQLARLDEVITCRNRNYDRFLAICRDYPAQLLTVDVPGRSSFVLPFLARWETQRWRLQDRLGAAGIESRPIVAGNLTRQPFLRGYYHPGDFPVADFLHLNGFYIGNHQAVDAARLDRLAEIMREVWS